MHRGTPVKCINFEPTSEEFYLDTLKASKKYLLRYLIVAHHMRISCEYVTLYPYCDVMFLTDFLIQAGSKWLLVLNQRLNMMLGY